MRAVDIFSVMTAAPPEVSVDRAEAVALSEWRIQARAKPLRGERDRNFLLHARDGRQFVLKFANPAEQPDFRTMQTEALRHIEQADPSFPVPRVIPLPGGDFEVSVAGQAGAIHQCRLFSWIEGDLLSTVPRSRVQREACGEMLARLQLALQDFHHPASRNPIVWDLQHSSRLREIVFAIPNKPAQERVVELIDEFEATVRPMMGHLRSQIVHNDMGVNTIVDSTDPDRVAGVIDFGDIAETAIIFDVAIAAAAHLGGDMGAAEAIGYFIKGFHRVRPLLGEEIALLPLLIALRMGMGLALASWHKHSQPDNPHFDLSETAINRRLAAMAEVRALAANQILRHVCGSGL